MATDSRLLTRFALQIAHWVADAVLDKEDARKRALIVKHFIQVADVRLQLYIPASSRADERD